MKDQVCRLHKRTRTNLHKKNCVRFLCMLLM